MPHVHVGHKEHPQSHLHLSTFFPTRMTPAPSTLMVTKERGRTKKPHSPVLFSSNPTQLLHVLKALSLTMKSWLLWFGFGMVWLFSPCHHERNLSHLFLCQPASGMRKNSQTLGGKGVGVELGADFVGKEVQGKIGMRRLRKGQAGLVQRPPKERLQETTPRKHLRVRCFRIIFWY